MATPYIAIARTLPARLTRFFTRYPPNTCNTAATNPFKPTVHPVTHRWHNPIFSLRRQAELCKMAEKYGVEELLPASRKSKVERDLRSARRAEFGVQKVRGHREERNMKARLEVRKQAMEKMPALIEKWKRMKHGRRWRDWPSGKKMV